MRAKAPNRVSPTKAGSAGSSTRSGRFDRAWFRRRTGFRSCPHWPVGQDSAPVHLLGVTRMLRITAALMLVLALMTPMTAHAQGGVRIKDITELEGSRSNQLVGFGLVVGLEGTG